ncbi:flagellin [Terasakiispira papahanaumokuakeensis]|uniref:Flagellin n=1 Tax=Terasakiispira papahanaumokuakeensis TaxID=197479 RepID=A0A1E2VBD8_9GAMM|nr:flagellin [Terasakiispira papahanaumokuakeensis]ODC04172.1 flagellin [Terasakiispira papahanaumokuakeensis]
MALVLNTNIAAINGQRNLSKTQADQATTFNRLSTGLRINSAKDDAAGLYLAESQTKDIRGLNMATRNASDGISMSQTAEGALDQITSNLQRINELAIQSANGTYDTAAREGIQKEVDGLTQEIARIVETTEFNGKKLLNTAATKTTLQVGFKNDSASQVDVGLSGGLSAALDAAGFGTAIGRIISGGLVGTGIIDLSTQTAARSAIDFSRNDINGISRLRANFGAAMNRFEAVISGNQTYSENLQAARSRIQDADFAEETSKLAKQQVLQQAGVSVLSQANASSQTILGLLQ